MNQRGIRFWAWPRELRRRGVLGMNDRNLRYIAELNPRCLFARVDDKAVTKELCYANGISVPETYGLVTRYGDIRRFGQLIGNRQQFVIKPVCGAEGRGVLVIARSRGGTFETSNGVVLCLTDVHYHLASILSGLFSLGGLPDKAIIEARVLRHPVFSELVIGGTPDVRVIVHQGRPIAAMLRLPTVESRGRANLHQGAIGIGIDIINGMTTTAVHHDRTISRHPDTGKSIADIKVPCWTDILIIAVRLSKVLELGYIGVDIVLDAKEGPMVLEANARPGLAIQIANKRGLLSTTYDRKVAAMAGQEISASALRPDQLSEDWSDCQVNT